MSTVNRFQCLEKLGEGTYGVVFKAKEIATGEILALKRVLINGEDEGVPATAMREVCLLKELRHDHIVYLHDVLFDPPKMTLVFEYCDCDLKKYMEVKRQRQPLDLEREIRPMLKQMLMGLCFMHLHSVVHRDLKPENIFISAKKNLLSSVNASAANERIGGEVGITSEESNFNFLDGLSVKLGDLGLARIENIPVKKYTHDVVSLWYRSPDVIFGSALYGFAVDMWSIGCIFAEMVTGRPLFVSNSETEQMLNIFRFLGTPTSKMWPSLPTYPKHQQVLSAVAQLVRQQHSHPLGTQENVEVNVSGIASWGGLEIPGELHFESLFDEYIETFHFRSRVGDDGVSLLRDMLQYEPLQRISAQDALNHPFLQNVLSAEQRPIDSMTALLTQALERHRLMFQEKV